jgi:hypothetical protein
VSKLQFVNLHGQRLAVGSIVAPALKSTGGFKRTEDRAKAKQSLGFEVVGVSEAARTKAAADAAKLAKPFDPAAWLAKQKAKRAVRKVFQLQSSAETAAAMLLKQGGWLRVEVAEILMAPK